MKRLMVQPTSASPLIIRRNIKLRLLKHEVDDERFLQIFADFAELIRRSERAYSNASLSGNAEYADLVAESFGFEFPVLTKERSDRSLCLCSGRREGIRHIS